MTLVRKVRVGKKTLTVVRRRMTKLFGRTYWIPRRGKGKILVDSSLTDVPALSTLLHEMLHQVNWNLSEKRIQHLEYALVTLVLSNPRVFADLAKQSPRRRPQRPR